MPFINFRSSIIDPLQTPTPWWLRERLGAALLYTLGAAHDHFAEYVYEGVSARYPSLAEEKALKQILRDRKIPSLDGEPLPSMRARARDWRNLIRLKGTPAGAMLQIQPVFLPEAPMIRVVAGNSARAMWATLNQAGELAFTKREPSNWDWDSAFPFHDEPTKIHRWHAIIYAPTFVTPAGSLVAPSAVQSLGSSLDAQRTNDIGRVFREWQRAGSVLWGWILAFDPESFEPTGGPGVGYPDGTWYRNYVVGGGYNRVDSARYHYDQVWSPA
jgi:hypothetical protein